MSGSHAHSEGISSRTMWLVTAITFTFCLGEALVGYKSNSLALMADAGHNFADSLALALSAFALWISTKPADNKRTFGYHRVGILVALVNAVGLVTMALVIFWEAIQRLQMPESVQSIPMIWMALLAIILNSGIAWWLTAAAKENLNIRSAYLHMLGDAAASLGVVIAGIVITLTSWFIADPIVSILFALLVLWSSWSIFTESIQMLLEAIPVGLELTKVEQSILNVKGVVSAHDLHVWTVSSGLIACSCHIVVEEQLVSSAQYIQEEVEHVLEHDFRISHTTIQIEIEDCGGHDHKIMTSAGHHHHHDHPHTH